VCLARSISSLHEQIYIQENILKKLTYHIPLCSAGEYIQGLFCKMLEERKECQDSENLFMVKMPTLDRNHSWMRKYLRNSYSFCTEVSVT
jgi:hypothetical protein